ncbi:MAG: hypothetical protein AB7F99_01535 [Vicinamibacterales bacterium]
MSVDWIVRGKPAKVTPDDCFADETAIDFPSVGHIVARVRDAFVDDYGVDEPRLLTAEVAVSRREALFGTTLPLRVPVSGACPECGGRGEVWPDPCVPCSGTGNALVHHPVRVSVPAGVADGARIRFRVTSPHAAPVRVEVRVRTSAA